MKSIMRMRTTANKRGVVLVTTLLMLALLTTMGIYSATRAAMEQNIATNAKMKTVAFFAAEAGLNHAKELLQQRFNDANTAVGASTYANWNFLLAEGPATHYHCQGCDIGESLLTGTWLSGGVHILTNTVNSGTVTYTYSVEAWDNWEHTFLDYDTLPRQEYFCKPPSNPNTGNTLDPYAILDEDPLTDCDSTIIIRSTAQAFSASGRVLAESVQELSVSSTTSGEAILPGLGQEFEGSGDIDLNAPTI